MDAVGTILMILSALLLGGLCLTLYLQQGWSLRCSFRREFVMLDGLHEIAKGIADDDTEAAAGALMEHFQRMANELTWQNTHAWSVRHPFTMPELPDYQELLKRGSPS